MDLFFLSIFRRCRFNYPRFFPHSIPDFLKIIFKITYKMYGIDGLKRFVEVPRRLMPGYDLDDDGTASTGSEDNMISRRKVICDCRSKGADGSTVKGR
jgi:hypothetical protein